MPFVFITTRLTPWRHGWRTHWPAWLGVALILFSAGVAATVLPAQTAAHTALVARARALQHAVNAPMAAVAVAALPLTARLAPLSTLARVTADMEALAEQHGLRIATASFAPVNDPVAPGVMRIEISATLHGGYLPTKKLLAAMLGNYPALALQSVALRRERSTEALLDVETHWILFCQKPA